MSPLTNANDESPTDMSPLMPIIHELIDNVALQISEKPTGQVCFCNVDLKNPYSQLKLCKKKRVSYVTLVLWAAKQRDYIGF